MLTFLNAYLYIYVCIIRVCICIYVYIYMFMYIYIYATPQRSIFLAFCWCQRGLGTFCKNKVSTLLLSKKMSTYSGQKAHHFLKEAICFKLQRSFPCLKQITFIHKLQFSFQTKYNFVQDQAWIQEVPPESWILNLKSRKVCKVRIFFWEVSACVHLYVFASFCWFNTYAYVYAYVFIWMYIYIWSPLHN